ncbi:hypothetical protein MTR67_052983 [Solanum verrucosum]|uniref:Uncharacterized protein n=1 Tax=Solanum verrucosum TaxID=315347 RepID=A0AAF1A3A6_SOLVR|nr:hypothetical protein MTR67_052983 [Solanum verrucosum]
MTNAHRRFNSIDILQVEGAEVTDPEEIKNSIVSFYQELYKESENWRPDFTLQGNTRISTEEQVWLERQFEEDEILEGLNQCAIEKAPGPDGFPMSFFITFWEMLKTDILLTLRNFHSQQGFKKSFNATFVALIPKKQKYGQNGQWCTDESTDTYGVGLWRTIRIRTFTGTTNEPDIIKWRHNTDGKFLVNRVYKRGLLEMTERDRGPWKATWRKGEGAKARRDGGKLSQLAYGGPYGRKGMREFSKEDQTPFNRSKGNAFLLYVFGVKSNV